MVLVDKSGPCVGVDAALEHPGLPFCARRGAVTIRWSCTTLHVPCKEYIFNVFSYVYMSHFEFVLEQNYFSSNATI